jgi:hypothetical protein
VTDESRKPLQRKPGGIPGHVQPEQPVIFSGIRTPGRGKRGGYRVIYFVREQHGSIWMLTMYPKNVTDNIPAHVLKQIRKEIENG